MLCFLSIAVCWTASLDLELLGKVQKRYKLLAIKFGLLCLVRFNAIVIYYYYYY